MWLDVLPLPVGLPHIGIRSRYGVCILMICYSLGLNLDPADPIWT